MAHVSDHPWSYLPTVTTEDDVAVPTASVRRYADAFPTGSVRRTLLKPGDFGLASLRHIQVLSGPSAPVWPSILGLSDERPEMARSVRVH